MRCAIHSANSGSVMVIPRERGLVRLYIQLTEVGKDSGQVDRSKITPDIILKAAQKTMAPYKLTYDYCDWWTAYQVRPKPVQHFSSFPLMVWFRLGNGLAIVSVPMIVSSSLAMPYTLILPKQGKA